MSSASAKSIYQPIDSKAVDEEGIFKDGKSESRFFFSCRR